MTLHVLLGYYVPECHDVFVYLNVGNAYIDDFS